MIIFWVVLCIYIVDFKKVNIFIVIIKMLINYIGSLFEVVKYKIKFFEVMWKSVIWCLY